MLCVQHENRGDLAIHFQLVKVWAQMNLTQTPEFSLLFKGSEAVDRSGVYHTVSLTDHPTIALAKSTMRANEGQLTQVALTVEKVDRTSLGPGFCATPETVAAFQTRYEIPYSRSSCEIMSLLNGLSSSCSLTPYSRIRSSDESLPTCLTRDVLFEFEVEPPMGANGSSSYPEVIIEEADDQESCL